MAPRSSSNSTRSRPEFGTSASLPRKNIPLPVPGEASISSSLLKAIATNSDPTLVTIDFSKRALHHDSLLPLLNALEGNTTVTALNFSSCGLTDSSCALIGELLSKNLTLQTLQLDNNQIGVEGAAALSTALITNEILTTITLSGNPLGDRGLIYLAKACGHNSTLTTLELEHCGITQTGRVEQLQNLLLKRRIDSNFESLLERLKDDDYRVTGIDLSGRALGDEGVLRLSEALADNTQVRQLWLRDCSLSNAGAKALASCLEQNMSIVDLFLGGNSISDEGLGYVSDALRGSNATLVSLEMDDNKISQRGIRDFISALRKNTSVLVATFKNNTEDTKYLHELNNVLEDRRNKMNMVSFIVDPEEENGEEKSTGLVDMSVCSSYMPSTYRRAGFQSVASTKGHSAGSHIYSIYNKTPKRDSFNRSANRQNAPGAAAAVPIHRSHSQPNTSPPESKSSSPKPNVLRSARNDDNNRHSGVTQAPPPPPRNGYHAPPEPNGAMAQPRHIVLRRSSSGSNSRSKRSNDQPESASHALTVQKARSVPSQSLVKVDSMSVKSFSTKGSKAPKTNEVQLTHHIAAMKVIQEADNETETEVTSLPSSHYSETAENYDKSLKSVCRRVEMMRLTNYFTATHYRSRQFWFWFTPLSSCIFLTGILSLASAVDADGSTTTSLGLCTAFFSLTAFILNFLQTRFGWSSLAQSHRSASLELTKVGNKLEDLKEYEGGLSSRSVSSRSRATAIREVYRIEVYLTAMQKCTPDIPMPIEQAFRYLVTKMEHFGEKYPNALKSRLRDYDDYEDFDPDDPMPLEMQLDAFDLLCHNIKSYGGFPLFLPNPDTMVGMTIATFFAEGQQRSSARSSSRSYGPRWNDSSSSYSRSSSASSYGSRSYDSYGSRSRTRTSRSMYSEDLYSEDRYTDNSYRV